MSTLPIKQFRLRSYVPRGRRTDAQERMVEELWPRFGLEVMAGMLNDQKVFGRDALRFLEIGFGSGQSLLALALENPDKDFIGVETHQPGIGALFQGIKLHKLSNLRVYYSDVIDVLEKCIPNESLSGVQIFFPDPWPKRRHHQRRLIQSKFIELIVAKLKMGGLLHLATDWEDYAKHMMMVVSQEPRLINLASPGQFALSRSSQRIVITKFERRALNEGREILELHLLKG